MSTDELAALKAEEDELQKRVNEIRSKRMLLEKSNDKVLTVTEVNEAGRYVFFTSKKFSQELSDYLTGLEGYQYLYGRHRLPALMWHKMIYGLNHGFEVSYGNWKDTLHKVINTEFDKILALKQLPNVVITLATDKKVLLITTKPEYEQTLFANVQGALRVGRLDEGKYKIPVAEGHRLWGNVKDLPKVEWSEEAKEFVVTQVEQRARLDDIALMVDSTLDISLNGVIPRPFQKVGIEFISANDGNALIADQMGLGKTLQAIGSIKHNGWYPAVIMMPASLKLNWMKEIYKLIGPDEEILILSGRVPTKTDFMNLLATPKPKWVLMNWDILGASTDVVTTLKDFGGAEKHETRYQWAELINLFNPAIIVGDEIHYLRNRESKRSVASRKLKPRRFLGLSGSPVMNRPGDMWPALTLIKPELFPSGEQFDNTYTWDKGRQVKNVEALRELLQPVMLRRTKSQVLPDLPPINRITEYHEMDDKSQALYERAEEGFFNAMQSYEEEGHEEEIPNILVKIMRMKQICTLSALDHCAEKAIEISDSAEPDQNKVLIFSQFKAYGCYALAKRLGNEALTMTGDHSMTEREDIKRRFINDPTKKFLIGMEDVMSEGHNLQVAWNCIFLDFFWTPMSHEQCEGRAYGRLADAHPIDSWWMEVLKQGGKPTIVKWIKEILDMKLNTAQSMTEGFSAERSKSILKELLKKMKEEVRKNKK